MRTEPIPLIVRRVIAAPRDRLFEAFGSADALSRWFTPSADVSLDVMAFDFAAGGRFRFRYVMPDGRRPVVGGIYEMIEPSTRIICSWIWEAPDPLADVPMRVHFEFSEHDGKTEVTITHQGIPSDQACSIHEDGWDGALNSLERYFSRADHERTSSWT
ncbi:MAG: SRPBCC domain-containing protein [Pseudomonadota bacterium]